MHFSTLILQIPVKTNIKVSDAYQPLSGEQIMGEMEDYGCQQLIPIVC